MDSDAKHGDEIEQFCVEPDRVLRELKLVSEWESSIVLDHQGRVIASNCQATDPEIRELLIKFDDYETTVATGITFEGKHFDVHRWYDHLIYGRNKIKDVPGPGVCIHKIRHNGTKKPIYFLATYVFPTVSARTIPQMVKFARQFLLRVRLPPEWDERDDNDDSSNQGVPEPHSSSSSIES